MRIVVCDSPLRDAMTRQSDLHKATGTSIFLEMSRMVKIAIYKVSSWGCRNRRGYKYL